jgi:hypothetical protein
LKEEFLHLRPQNQAEYTLPDLRSRGVTRS